jgi:hypothetical protein
LNEKDEPEAACSDENSCLEDYLEMLPNGKSQKNSILLTWKKRYFKLSNGTLVVYEEKPSNSAARYLQVYNLMGGKVEYESPRVICLDDSRGNCPVIRCLDDAQFAKWKEAIDAQIIDREQSLWVKPSLARNKFSSSNKV